MGARDKVGQGGWGARVCSRWTPGRMRQGRDGSWRAECGAGFREVLSMAPRRAIVLRERTCLFEETSRRPGTVWGGVQKATPGSGAAMGEAGVCRRDRVPRATSIPHMELFLLSV